MTNMIYATMTIFDNLWQVLESIVGGGVVQVVNQSLDSGSVWLGTAQLLNCQADVLVGAGATADVAGGAGCDKQTLATNHLLLGQGGGLALVIHLKSSQLKWRKLQQVSM